MASLSGQRILVTRSADDCDDWARQLQRAGAEPVIYPCISAAIIETPALRETLSAAAAAADWLIVTSRRGVEAFAALHPAALNRGTRVAAVGAATGAAARRVLGRIDHVGRGTAAALAATLPGDPSFRPGARCLLAVAANAGQELERALAAAGAVCTRCDVYRTIPAAAREPKQRLSALRADKILLASPSAVEGFVNQVDFDVPARIFTIGPSTSAAARRHDLTVEAEAREPSLEALMEAMDG